MKNFKYIFLFLLLGCHGNSEIKYTYDMYQSSDNSLLHKNTMTIIKKEIANNEYILTIDHFYPYKNYDTAFYHTEFFEKYTNQGIYRKIKKDDNYVLYYRYDSLNMNQENNLKLDFFASQTSSSKKQYKIKNQRYTIYCNTDNHGSAFFANYYLKDFGYLMFDFNTKEYMKLASVSRYPPNFNKKILDAIIDSLEHDYEFFSIYIFSTKNKKYQQFLLYIDSLAKNKNKK